MSPAVGFQDATAIAGIAQTAFAKHLEPTEAELALHGDRRGLRATPGSTRPRSTPCARYTMEATEEVDIARNIGCGEITFFGQIGYGGGAGCGVVGPCGHGGGHGAGRGGRGVAVAQARVGAAGRGRTRRPS